MEEYHRAFRAARASSGYYANPAECSAVKSAGAGFMGGALLTEEKAFRPGNPNFYVFYGVAAPPNDPSKESGQCFKIAYPHDHNRAGEVHAHVIVINTAVLFHRTPETEEWRVLLHETAHYGGFTHDLLPTRKGEEPTIRNWVKQADLDEGRRSDGLTTEARKEMRRLKHSPRRSRWSRRTRWCAHHHTVLHRR